MTNEDNRDNVQQELFEYRENILLALREEPYKQIIENNKKFEYRTRFTKNKTRAYIYISQTIKKIVAIIDFDCPISGTAQEIAKFAQDNDGCDYNEILQWLNSRDCNALPIQRVYLIEPIEMDDIKNLALKFSVPQSYYRLDNKQDLLQYLESNSKVINTIEF